MHICIDYRPALHESTGVGTYARGLIRGLIETHPENVYTAFSASLRHRLDTAELPPGARVVDVRWPVRLLDLSWHRFAWPPIERWVGPQSIVHSPSPMLLPSRHAARVVTVHDCYFLRHPEHVTGPMQRDYVPLLRRSIRDADAIVTNTYTTREELLELVPDAADKVHVTPLGVDAAFESMPDTMPEPAGLRSGYFLFVGRREPRKDPATLLAAFDRILERQAGARLVMVGPDGLGWSQTWASASQRVRDATTVMPHQPAARLVPIYAAAAALLLPSRWEGFGLTAIEAMAVGTPVIASRAGALPEVLGDAARWVGVGDDEALAAACTELQEHPDRGVELAQRGRQQASRYRWRTTAELTQQVYSRLEQRS